MSRQQSVQDTKAVAALKGAIKDSRSIFIAAGVFGLAINVLMLTGPLYMLQVYDRVLASQSVPTLVALTGLVAGLYITLGFLDWIRQSIFTDAGSRFEDKLSEPAFEAVIGENMRDPGKLSERTLSSLRQIRKFYSGPAFPAIFDIPFSPMFYLVLFMLHWAYGLWAIFGTIVLVILAVINKQVSSASVQRAEELERHAQQTTMEVMRNVEVMEAMGMRGRMAEKWRGLSDESDQAIRKSSHSMGAFAASTKVFRLFLQSAILGLGAYLSIIGVSTPGAMIAASIIMGRAIAPIQSLVGQWRTIVSAGTAWTALKQQLEATADEADSMELPPIKGHLRLENVYSGPPSVRENTLRGISLEIEPGDMLGVLGPSASGKSSFARVVLGLWRARHGVVRIDGADVRTYSREQLGPQVGYLPQHVDLFSGSVMENICRFDPEATPQDIVAAAQAAGCHHMILALPDGYNTPVGVNGSYLSAGQRQRVGLARALYKEPNFVILDEPNSNLDNSGDQALANALHALKQRGATSVIIAHRPNAIVHCTKLAVIESGELKAFGPRDEILPKVLPKGAVPGVRPAQPLRAASSEDQAGTTMVKAVEPTGQTKGTGQS
ncbi:MAG: type I secretion system permease/ATPase [Pseudomonadota bacterium]